LDLGLNNKRALVCGASAGLGLACAQALAREGAHILSVARREDLLKSTSQELLDLGAASATWCAGDITTEEGRSAVFQMQSDFDIVVTNAGGPMQGDFRGFQRDDWLKAMDANMLTPIEITKRVLDGMMQRGFGRIVHITSSGVKQAVVGLDLSNGVRSGLTGFMAGLARSAVQRGVTINQLLPGTFDTDRLVNNFKAQSQRTGIDAQTLLAQRLDKHPAKRLGRPEELGAMCAFLCSQYAGYINGQNILMDGGSYLGV
jgi:3-oxoacyl-[acyl-carrier protein] reductase